MKVIDQINGSALFAQSAYSAAVATKDDLGRDITATYLTAHQSLDGYATTSDLEQVSAEVTNKLDVTAQVISSCETSSIDGETLVTKLNGNEIAVEYAGSARIANIALKDYQGNSFVPFYAKTSALENKLDTTAFSTVSGDFLTTSFGISESGAWNEATDCVQTNSAQWGQGGGAGDEEVNQAVHTNSATWNTVTDKLDTTSFSYVSGTFLTGVNIPESATWNDVSTTVQSNSAQWSQGASVPVSNSGDLYKVEFDGVDLYGYKSTTDIPNYSYSVVSSQETTYLQHTPYPQWNNPAIQDFRNWSAVDIISISSNGGQIYPSYYGDNGLTALDVYYKASYVYDYNNNQLPDFSGYVGKITLDNLVISSYFDKPSYFNDIERCSEFKLWFSGNQHERGIDNHYICSVGKAQSGTNTISGIIVPSAVDLSNYYTTADANTLSSMLSGAIEYVSANAGTGYVPLTATEVKIGNSNTASYYSLVQGRYNNADTFSFSQGYLNSAYELTLVQGSGNKANFYSLAQGQGNSARNNSFAQGMGNSAYLNSLAQGSNNSAQNYSFSLGLQNSARLESIAVGVYNTAGVQSMAVGYACEASNRSQALGSCVSATNSGMAIGTYNNVTTGAFVIGNGNSATRSDCFIIDHNGNVSAAGKISANGVELELSNYVPYTASGVELPNSHFKIDTDGRAYKLEVLDSTEQTLTTGDFSAQKTLNYPFGQDKHYVIQVPTTRIEYEVREYIESPLGGNAIIGNQIISGDVQNGICDFVYPSSGVTGKKFFVTWNEYTTASLTTANCKLYTISSVSPSGEYVLASDLNYISASYDNLYNAFTAYTASHP